MSPKVAGFVVAGAVLIILVMGAGLFVSMYKKTKTSNAEIPGLQREITLAEVQQHNSAQDCWTYVGGMVFDATKVIKANSEHTTVLASVCGKDGTSVYTVQKYSSQELDAQTVTKLRDTLGAYQLGMLSP